MPVAPAIRCIDLTKRYGSRPALDGLDLVVERGEVVGFLGPNGAGKTTTIRLLLDLIRPTRGRAEVLGLDARRDAVAVRRRVGYVPGELRLYEGLTARELLTWFARLRAAGAGRIEPLAERLDLDLDRRIGGLSGGNKQKVAIVQALMHGPDLLVLDEPTTGLDPLVKRELQHVLDEHRARGGSVFLSSHVLGEVERIADRVAMVRAGRLVEVADVATLKERSLRRVEIAFGAPVAAEEFAPLPGVHELEVDGNVLRCSVTGPLDALVKAAARHEVLGIESREPDLEEIFLHAFGSVEAGGDGDA